MEVFEYDVARRRFPEGNLSRIFAIVGIQNLEGTEDEWIYKGRVVFGGDSIKDGKCEWAILEELGSAYLDVCMSCAPGVCGA